MNIIKHSKKSQKQYHSFTCKCGCVFECEENEYWEKPQIQYESSLGGSCSCSYSAYKLFITCCPECHKIVKDTVYDSCSITASGANTGNSNGDNILKNTIKTNYNNRK